MKRAFAVIGAGYGDEGKGLMTDFLCSQHLDKKPIVVRYNGGAQAGHTVKTPSGQKHVFSHFGSGTLLGVGTYFAPEFILNPVVFSNEFKDITDKMQKNGIKGCKLGMSKNCRVTTIYDMCLNQAIEMHRNGQRHGSCGLGIFETITRHKEIPLTAEMIDTLSKEEFMDILVRIKQYCIKRLESLGIPAPESITLTRKMHDEVFWSLCLDLITYVEINDNFLEDYDTFIFEGAQGLLLSERHGIMPHLTPSDPGCTNVLDVCKKFNVTDIELCYTTRVYTTRHGAGPLVGESSWQSLGLFEEAFRDETNVTNEFQGSFRYSPLDVESVSSAIMGDAAIAASINPKISLATTCVDQVKALQFVVSYLPALNNVNDIVKPSTLYVSRGPTRETMDIVEQP
jgi:adenylosuccinate synthase